MDFLDRPLDAVDPETAKLLGKELKRQRETLDLIASENYAPQSILECQGSVLTNKYAEGYPGKRYYAGCEIIDQIEELAISRARSLFGAQHVNVQPHSGASANAAAFQALISPGDKLMGLDLASGGHLTHGMKLNFSGQFYKAAAYSVEPDTGTLDMNKLSDLVIAEKPQLLIAGWSAYPRQLDFAAFRAIADQVGAYLLVDMSHFSGLVAAGVHESPVPFADVVTSTTHKTLGGPRAGFIMCKDDLAAQIDRAVFPGTQGGPLEHVIAAKAVAFRIATTREFQRRQIMTVEAASSMASYLHSLPELSVISGGTDVHSFLLDLRQSSLDGLAAEKLLSSAAIVVNRNAIPFDPAPPLRPSGIRLGTPSLISRGFSLSDVDKLAVIIGELLLKGDQPEALNKVEELCRKYPLYPGIEE